MQAATSDCYKNTLLKEKNDE